MSINLYISKIKNIENKKNKIKWIGASPLFFAAFVFNIISFLLSLISKKISYVSRIIDSFLEDILD